MATSIHLRAAREAEGLTQEQLVDRMRKLDPDTAVEQNTISRLETRTRRHEPPLDMVKALGRALKVDPWDLTFGPPEKRASRRRRPGKGARNGAHA